VRLAPPRYTHVGVLGEMPDNLKKKLAEAQRTIREQARELRSRQADTQFAEALLLVRVPEWQSKTSNPPCNQAELH
jgi:hypothetical protein